MDVPENGEPSPLFNTREHIVGPLQTAGWYPLASIQPQCCLPHQVPGSSGQSQPTASVLTALHANSQPVLTIPVTMKTLN